MVTHPNTVEYGATLANTELCHPASTEDISLFYCTVFDLWGGCICGLLGGCFCCRLMIADVVSTSTGGCSGFTSCLTECQFLRLPRASLLG